jgi:hypothetical protein
MQHNERAAAVAVRFREEADHWGRRWRLGRPFIGAKANLLKPRVREAAPQRISA